VRGELVEQVGETGDIPTVAARPEDAGTVLGALVEIAGVADEEVNLRVPELVGGGVPLAIHVGEVAGIVSLSSEASPGGRRHEEGVAVPPGGLGGIVRLLQKIVELGADGLEMMRVRLLLVELQVDLADGLVVGTGFFRGAELPVEVLGGVPCEGAIARFVEGLRSREQAEVERGEPLGASRGVGNAGDLPVCDFSHGGFDSGWGECGRDVGGKWAGVGGCVAGDDFGIILDGLCA